MIVSGANVDLTSLEMEVIRKKLNREPNALEAGMLDIMWSEHCSYKSSRPLLKLLPTSGKRVVLGPGFDSGIIEIGNNLCIAFKIESHNHPSAIDPYSGAATGVGGIIRDILAVGARPIALLDSLYFGKLSSDHSKWLLKYVVKGIADYGNCTGIPTVAGNTNFDECFERNCLVNAACFGIVEKNKIILGKAKDAGDLIVLAGSTTGRDGIHGVTFASKNLHKKSDEERPAVQIPDPFLKKLLIEASLEALATGKVKAIKDFGGGGLTCCASELAYKGGKGAIIEVSSVPLREPNLTPFEVLLSESQERMLFSVAPKDLKVLEKVLNKYGVKYSVIGKTTKEKRFVITENGKTIADLPIELLTEVPTVSLPSKKPEYLKELLSQKTPSAPENLNAVLSKLLRSENICSKRWIYQQYDHEVGIRTVIKPGEGDSAVLRVSDRKGIAIKSDCNYRFCYLDPYNGAAETVFECARNLASVGASAIGMVDNLNFGNPKKPDVFWQFEESVKGIADACNLLNVPCVGGNVSFYNEDDVLKRAIKPSPVITLLGQMDDVNSAVSMPFKAENESVIIIGNTGNELGGSSYLYEIFSIEGGKPPTINFSEEKKKINFVLDAIRNHLVTACHDCSDGGIAISLSEMALKSCLGAEIFLDKLPSHSKLREDELLFSETPGRFVITSKEPVRLLKLAKEHKVSASIIGKTVANRRLTIFDSDSSRKRIIDCALNSLKEDYESGLKCSMQ